MSRNPIIINIYITTSDKNNGRFKIRKIKQLLNVYIIKNYYKSNKSKLL